eukprot:460582_1
MKKYHYTCFYKTNNNNAVASNDMNQFGDQNDNYNVSETANPFDSNEQKGNTNTLHNTTQFENNDDKTQINPLDESNHSIQHDNDTDSLNINNMKTKESESILFANKSHDKTVLNPF